MAGNAQYASSGHKLGQRVGDWFEEYFVYPLLQEVESQLNLFLDCRFKSRQSRGEKIVWQDLDGNFVDYDFVLEIGGSSDRFGAPVAFVESFWRRGSRHSKDKARDDSGKLSPMRDTHPTARFLGIVAAGDFTLPARDLLRNRGIDLFYVPKVKLISAFQDCGLIVDYPDRSTEEEKSRIAADFDAAFSKRKKKQVARKLREYVSAPTLESYVHRVRAAIGALPQEIRLFARQTSQPVVFETAKEATQFLREPSFGFDSPSESFLYEVDYSDGSTFQRDVETVSELRTLHSQIEKLVNHVAALSFPARD